MKHVVTFIIPARPGGIRERIDQLRSQDGNILTYPTREHAEKVAERLNKASRTGTSFHYGHLGQYVREAEQ